MAQTAIAEPATVAFEAFFEAERTRLFRAVCLITGDAAGSEEVVQDAFLHLWERWDRVKDMDHRTGYLYRTALNEVRSSRRRIARAARLAIAPRREADAFEEADLRDSVLRALRTLGPRQRAAVVLMDLLGYGSSEAGELLGIKGTTVRTLAAEARAALRTELETFDA